MFPDGKYIIQVGPYSSGIFKINYNEVNLNKIKEYNSNRDKFKSDLESEKTQLNKNYNIDKSRQIMEFGRIEKL